MSSSSPYSFIAEPQPAALVMMWSTSPSDENSEIALRARTTAASSSPECICSAPQQSGDWGASTSNPSAARVRIVARCTSA